MEKNIIAYCDSLQFLWLYNETKTHNMLAIMFLNLKSYSKDFVGNA
jgi:hypothetical protein